MTLQTAFEHQPNCHTGSPPKAAPAPVENVLRVEGLEARYGEHLALQDVNIRIPARRVTAIMGPSGCGKSTLVKSLNRTLELTAGARVTAGSVFLGEVSLYDPEIDCRAVRKALGIIHQRPQPFPMSIEENVLFGVRFHQRPNREARRRLVQEYLDRVGLWEEIRDRLRQPAHRLSGGQQQRLCLARTLANRPQVILMDEPCSSLDPASTERIERLIRTLCHHYTLVVVTHNLAQARRIADETVLMMDGRVVETGDADTVFNHPRTGEGRDFLCGRIG